MFFLRYLLRLLYRYRIRNADLLALFCLLFDFFLQKTYPCKLTPGPSQVLTTFCDAIDRHDLTTAWGRYAQVLQKERAVPPPPSTRITIVHCRVDQVSDTSATGFLLLKTIGPYGYSDDYERPFQFTLSVEAGAWKITQIARCLADGCLDDTASVVL